MATSKRQQIIDDLRRQIESGELAPGARLPSARELRERYGETLPDGTVRPVSITPVREAVNFLKAVGLVEGVPGVAVFVTERDGGS